MRLVFNLDVECDDRKQISNLLNRIKNEVDCGWYDLTCVNYDWEITELQDSEEEGNNGR